MCTGPGALWGCPAVPVPGFAWPVLLVLAQQSGGSATAASAASGQVGITTPPCPRCGSDPVSVVRQDGEPGVHAAGGSPRTSPQRPPESFPRLLELRPAPKRSLTQPTRSRTGRSSSPSPSLGQLTMLEKRLAADVLWAMADEEEARTEMHAEKQDYPDNEESRAVRSSPGSFSGSGSRGRRAQVREALEGELMQAVQGQVPRARQGLKARGSATWMMPCEVVSMLCSAGMWR